MKLQNGRMKWWILSLWILGSFGAGSALGDGLAQQTTSSIVSNSTPQNNAGDADNDRAYNLGDAASQSGNGSNTAALTGMALVSAAIPMLSSPLPPVRAAGATLMGEAGMEFAQAGADKGTQNQNSQGQQSLNNSEGDTASSPSNSTNNSSSDLASQLQQMLSSQGVPNSEGLAQGLTSGSLSSPSSVLQAMGDNTNYSADDLAQGAQLAAQQFQSAVGSSSTSTTPAAITYNSDAQSVPGGASGGSGGSSSQSGMDASDSSQNLMADSGQATPAATSSAAAGNQSSAAVANMQGTLAKQPAFLASSFLTNLLGTQGQDAAHKVAANTMALRNLGVQKAIAGQNIFQLARHNYHSFRQWRRTSLLAARN